MSFTVSKEWIISIFSGLLFFFIAAPFTYQVTGFLTSWNTSSKSGCPNYFGLILHAIVFAILVRISMAIPFQSMILK